MNIDTAVCKINQAIYGVAALAFYVTDHVWPFVVCTALMCFYTVLTAK